MFQKLSDKIDGYNQNVIDIQKLLVSIPAMAPENEGDGEIKKAEALMEYLKKEGFPEPQNYPAPDDRVSSGKRPNLVYRIKGQDSSKTIWMMSHLDVVPSGTVTQLTKQRSEGGGCHAPPSRERSGLCLLAG